MTRPAAFVLAALALTATGCASQSPPETQEPAPSNQAGPEESGAPAEGALPEAGQQPPPAGVGETAPPATSGGSDRDGDGIGDDMDRCPDDPEDRDGFQDEDGCPDPDNDQDGILDIDDKCPAQPEDKDGRQDEDGCPE